MKTIKFKLFYYTEEGFAKINVYWTEKPFAIIKGLNSELEALEALRDKLKSSSDWEFIEDVNFIEVEGKTKSCVGKGSLKAFLDSLEFDYKTEPVEERPTFERELAILLNLHAIDSECNTPDYVLARFVKDMLQTYAKSVILRDNDETVKMFRKNGN